MRGRAWRAAAWLAAIPVLGSLARVALDAAGEREALVLAVQAAAAAGLLGALAAAGASLSRAPLRERLGLGRGSLRARAIAWALAGTIGLSHAADSALVLLGVRGTSALARFDAALAGLGPLELAPPLLALVALSAPAEELFFRGLLQRGLVGIVGAPAAIAGAALAFGAAHGDWAHGAAAAVLGLYLGVLAHRAGSIRVAIGAHAANNALAALEAAVGAEAAGAALSVAILIGGGALAACGLGRARGFRLSAEGAGERLQ